MNKIVALADQQTFATSHDIKEDLEGEDVKINERTIRRLLNEVAKFRFSEPMSKPMLTDKHRLNRLKWAT